MSENSGEVFAVLMDLDPGSNDHPTTTDKEWFPLNPGTQHTYEGFNVENGEKTPHRIVFTVTDLTQVIGGVRVVVIFDTDYSNGQLDAQALAQIRAEALELERRAYIYGQTLPAEQNLPSP